METLKLKYIGKQEWPGEEPVRYWNVLSDGPSKGSTLSIQGLRDWGLL